MKIWQAWLLVVGLALFTIPINWTHFGGLKSVAKFGPVHFVDACIGKFPIAHAYLTKIHPWVDAACYSYIPICITIVCCCTMTFKMKSMTNQIAPNVGLSSIKLELRRITKLTIALSLVFILLTFPSMTVITIYRANQGSAMDPYMTVIIFISVTLALLSHSVNIFVYMAISKQFREDMYKRITCGSGMVAPTG